jgi:LacI family transcriptional regulator
MKDIADDLGVSLMTVSKALRSHSDISEKTRNRVPKRMRELNHQPDWIARSMVTGRTYFVGLVLPDLRLSPSWPKCQREENYSRWAIR